MNENFDQNTDFIPNEEVNTQNISEDINPDIAVSEESKKQKGSFLEKIECILDKHGKLFGACTAAVVAILLIIAAIFIIAASANLSRMAKQQMDINEKAEEYLDNISSKIDNFNLSDIFGGGSYDYGANDYDSFLDIFGQGNEDADASDSFSGNNENNFDWEDLIDIFSSDGSTDNAAGNGFDLEDIISVFGDLIPQGN